MYDLEIVFLFLMVKFLVFKFLVVLLLYVILMIFLLGIVVDVFINFLMKLRFNVIGRV